MALDVVDLVMSSTQHYLAKKLQQCMLDGNVHGLVRLFLSAAQVSSRSNSAHNKALFTDLSLYHNAGVLCVFPFRFVPFRSVRHPTRFATNLHLINSAI